MTRLDIKFMRNFLVIGLAACGVVGSAWAHGPGHVHRSTSTSAESASVDPHAGHVHDEHCSHSGKSFAEPVLVEDSRLWGASLTTGWESRHVHYGVDETGNYGAYTTELGVSVGNLFLSAWSGFGIGNDFVEWDFTAAYNIEIGPVFFIPGYNLRWMPGGDSHGGDDDHDDHDDHDHHDEDDHDDHDHGGGHHHHHAHKQFGNELFFVLGTTAIPYVTPTMAFIWDLNNTPGAFMEFRLDGEVPITRSVSLNPYALLGLNFGYNTRDYYGWNNFQFGAQANWQLNSIITAFAGVNYSVAMTALRSIDQGNVVWANVGVTFSY